jgi:hypothetical protein
MTPENYQLDFTRLNYAGASPMMAFGELPAQAGSGKVGNVATSQPRR